MHPQAEVRVWDPLVRVFHWSLVAAFFTAYLTEDDFLNLHVTAGYLIAGLVTIRLIWGVVGTRHARFSNFVAGPAEVIAYLKEVLRGHPRRYLGHNPAGGAMILALILLLLLTLLSGLALYGAAESSGPLAALFSAWSHDQAEWLEEAHELFANLTLLCVALHVGGVVMASLQHRENLVRAMVTGRKAAD